MHHSRAKLSSTVAPTRCSILPLPSRSRSHRRLNCVNVRGSDVRRTSHKIAASNSAELSAEESSYAAPLKLLLRLTEPSAARDKDEARSGQWRWWCRRACDAGTDQSGEGGGRRRSEMSARGRRRVTSKWGFLADGTWNIIVHPVHQAPTWRGALQPSPYFIIFLNFHSLSLTVQNSGSTKN